MTLKHRLSAVVLSAVLIASSFLVLWGGTGEAQEDPRDPGKANQLLGNFTTPGTSMEGMKPGDRGEFRFKLRNPYEAEMTNISLNASIYLYATLEETREVTSSWKTPHIDESDSTEYLLPQFSLSTGEERNVSFAIVTETGTPHGSAFSQSAYFLRFWLEFDYKNSTNVPEHLVMKSRGYFSDDVWNEATREPGESDRPYYRGEINLTYLREATGKLDGIIPDSSFALKEPIPMWPFYALIALMVVSAFLALMFYLEENPGKWPWMERRWLGFRSRLYQRSRLARSKRKGDDGKQVREGGDKDAR